MSQKDNTVRSKFRRVILGLGSIYLPIWVKKRDEIVLKIGDRFKDKKTGKIYVIKREMGDGTLFLEGENGLGRKLTD